MKALLLCLLLAGCSSVTGGTFQNRVSCTVGKDGAYYVSMYGPIGVASKIERIDAEAICSR